MKGFLEGVNAGFIDFGKGISCLAASLLLSFVYLLGIGMTYVSARVFNKRFMEIGKTKKKTWWKEALHEKTKKEDCYRQF